VLVACEFSGMVREAFRKRNHNAWSCDLLPAEDGSLFHIQDDIMYHLDNDWDLMIAHPPCTHLSVSGARWFKNKRREQAEAIEFVKLLADAPIEKIAIENPVGVLSTRWRKPDQIIQPWQFGDSAQKTTCLWLKGLPKLTPTNIVDKGEFVVFKSGKRHPKWYADAFKKGKHGHLRSITFPGIAEAMAEQWGGDNG